MREVAASGAGPYYGLLPSERWSAALYGDVSMPDFARRQCPWTPGVTKAEFEAIAKTMDEPFQGLIAIADQGCADYATLVITGPSSTTRTVALLGHPEPFFRFEACAALGDTGVKQALPALEGVTGDAAMPRAKSRSTAWSVGENAKRALAKLRL